MNRDSGCIPCGLLECSENPAHGVEAPGLSWLWGVGANLNADIYFFIINSTFDVGRSMLDVHFFVWIVMSTPNQALPQPPGGHYPVFDRHRRNLPGK